MGMTAMDFELSETQNMILAYGGELARTYDRGYWMENARATAGRDWACWRCCCSRRVWPITASRC